MTRRRGKPAEPVRWCEYARCERLAVVLVTDLEGFTEWVCRDHWHKLYRRSKGGIQAVQIISRTWRRDEWER